MQLRVMGLRAEEFRHLYGLDEAALAALGVRRMVVDKCPGFPDRIELRDMAVGEMALLLNYVHQPAETPYRASHAIFVREGAEVAYDRVGAWPAVLADRLLSLRAFDAAGMMVDAEVVEGVAAPAVIEGFFGRAEVAYVQAHNARRGCYAARIERA